MKEEEFDIHLIPSYSLHLLILRTVLFDSRPRPQVRDRPGIEDN